MTDYTAKIMKYNSVQEARDAYFYKTMLNVEC